MGREITGSRFRKADFERFGKKLREETDRLRDWLKAGRVSRRHGIGGYELEAWLVDSRQEPAPVNEELMARMPAGVVTPELARFNFELGAPPREVGRDFLSGMHGEMAANWRQSRLVAADLGAAPVMIGILPTLTDAMLGVGNMSRMERYKALNEQILRQRRGRPLPLDIQGHEYLHTEHQDVMLEAATTSFQLHLQVAVEKASRFFNAAMAVSGPMVGATANSPFLFGKRLWRETRIPLFEQSVAAGGFGDAAFGPVRRATFGSGYVQRSLMEVFQENLEHFPVLLPVELDDPPETLPHLRLHNGTIWRWNRPLVGFDDDGTPHLRVEHRVVPAGPTPVDSVANAALFFGLVRVLAEQPQPPEEDLEYATARENFYRAAKHGLEAVLAWVDGRHWRLEELLRRRLLPMAREGLQEWGCNAGDTDRFLEVIAERVRTRQTGAAWQIAYAREHGRDFAALVAAYRTHQDEDRPVHEWPV